MFFVLAIPSVSSKFEETQAMCYVCCKVIPQKEILDVPEEMIEQLEDLGLGIIQKPEIPKHFCSVCYGDIVQSIECLNAVVKANTFWRKFGLSIKIIEKQKPLSVTDPENDLLLPSQPANKQFHCYICDLCAGGKVPLYKHIWTEHVINKINPSLCSSCNKRFSDENRCRIHYFTTHFGEKSDKIICSYCGMVCRNQRHWAWHVKTTHDILPKVRICNKIL